MNYQNIVVEREERLFVVTINRPDVLNALNPATQFELQDAFDEFEQDPELWVAIITGAGDKAFSAGGDIQEMAKARLSGARDQHDYDIPETGYGGLTARYSLTKPVIAAVNGLAMGGGFEVAMAADLVVAAEHASFGLPEPKIGVVALAGGMHMLPRQIGMKPAMEILLTGDPIDANRAHELGLINQVVPAGQVMAAARKMAERILMCSPIAVQATKQCATQGLGHASVKGAHAAQEGGDFERYNAVFGSDDLTEGLIAFTEKRRPAWRGR